MAVGYLAILKYGCIVVPIDVDSPSSRGEMILRDSGAAFVLTSDKTPKAFCPDEVQLISVDVCESGDEESIESGGYGRAPLSGPAVIVYTSGSTGVPKGVVITHANLTHYVVALQQLFSIGRQDVYLLRGSVTLITFARQLVVPLSLGASVVMASPSERKNPLALLALVKRTHVTIFDHVPSFWKGVEAALSHLRESERQSLFDLKVRLVAAGGENVSRDVIRFWFSAFRENVAFYHLYGQTEGTGVVSAFLITPSDAAGDLPIPVGNPVTGMGMRILDENLEPVADYEKGEICIYGQGVAMGYWNRSSLSGSVFLSGAEIGNALGLGEGSRIYKTGDYGRRREDGEIEFLGRIDNQVKIRGHRVELAEIEKAIQAYPGIGEAVVVNCPGESGDPLLIGYFEARQPVEASALLMFLRDILSPHMIPSRYAQLQRFPLVGSGKVDRKALQSPEFTNLARASSGGGRPLDDLELRIAKVWEAVLEVERVGSDDSFFGFGGDSLKAVALILALEKEFGFSIPVEGFQQFSTVESFANDIKTKWGEPTKRVSCSLSEEEYRTQLMTILGTELRQVKPGSLIVQINENGGMPPLFWCFNSPQKEMSALARNLPESQPLFGLLSSIQLENTQDALERVAAHYVDELLGLFPDGSFRLGGNCRGAKVVCEMIRLFQGRGIVLEKVCLLEFFHPDLYQFEGDLCLLFGRHSHLKRYELLKFDQEGWDAPFVKLPLAEWIDCAHGVFFDDGNIGDLSAKVKRWLYSDREEGK